MAYKYNTADYFIDPNGSAVRNNFRPNMPTMYNSDFANAQAGSSAASAASAAAGASAGLGSKLSGIKNWFGKNFAWDKGTGLTAFGKDVGKHAPYVAGIASGVQALGGLSDLSGIQKDNQDTVSSILRSAGSNPTASSYLSADQLALLNKIRRGNYSADASLNDGLSNPVALLTGAGKGALTGGLFGGLPGAIVGGIGGLVNSGIDNAKATQQQSSAELAGLYQALADAEAQYRAMKRPNFTGLGIQQRYQNMYA